MGFKDIFLIIKWEIIFDFMLLLTHSQLLEGPKCESQIENNGKARSWGTLPGSQHLKGVEGRARALGWD
jgi:hypothetical protein